MHECRGFKDVDGTEKAYFWDSKVAKNVSLFNFNLLEVY